MATWRLAGFDTRGRDLELSELQLWSSTAQLDGDAVVTCSHPPAEGAVASLSDGDLQTICRWPSHVVQSPGFYIQWETAGAPTHIKIAAGADAQAHLHACHLQTQVGGRWVKQRTYEGLQAAGSNDWYVTAPLARYVSHTEDAVVTASTVTCAIPSDVIAGHLLFAVIMHRSPLTPTAGWSVAVEVPKITSDVGVSQYLTVLVREAQAGDAGATVTFNQASVNRMIAGVVVVDTGGNSFDLASLVHTESPYKQTGPEDPCVSPAITLLESDFGLFGVATYYYAIAPRDMNPWTVLPPVVGVHGVTPALVSGEQRRLVVSYAQGMVGNVQATQYSPLSSAAQHAYSYFSLRIRPSATRLLTQGRAAGVFLAAHRVAATAPVLPQREIALRPLRFLALDMECGGNGGIYGTVELYAQAGNIPLPRRVRLHRSRDGLLVRETWSDAQGNYRFDHITDRYTYDVIAWDHEGLQQSVVANDLTPEPMQ